MSEDDPGAADDADLWARTTAPQSGFSTGEVLEGLVVLAVGLVVAFGLPLVLA